jgi:hypothetical protein
MITPENIEKEFQLALKEAELQRTISRNNENIYKAVKNLASIWQLIKELDLQKNYYHYANGTDLFEMLDDFIENNR